VEGTPQDQAAPEPVETSIGSGVDAILEAAREAAAGIVADAQAEGRRLHAAAEKAAHDEAGRLAAGNRDLRNEANVLAGRRDRIRRELESIAHDLEDAIAEVAPDGSGASLGEAVDVRRRS
jgi:F0F1-type ATP synthase membrane subunit b/b'